MKTPLATKLAILVLALLVAGAAALAIRTSLAVRDLDRRAAALQEAVDGLTDAMNAKDELAAAARAAQAEDGAAQRDLEPILLKLRALGRRLDALEAGDIEDLGIETLIDRKLLEKMPRAGGARQRFARLEELGERLGLSDAQKRRAAEVIDRAKDQALDLLRAKDDEGLSMSDRIAETIKGPGTRQEKTRRILTDLFDRPVPGSDDSYFTALTSIRQGAIADFKGGLDGDQLSAFGALGIDVFGIETGYSPFAEEAKNALTGQQ